MEETLIVCGDGQQIVEEKEVVALVVEEMLTWGELEGRPTRAPGKVPAM